MFLALQKWFGAGVLGNGFGRVCVKGKRLSKTAKENSSQFFGTF
jgi:hypothetical protein